jgi:hypothetical protein
MRGHDVDPLKPHRRHRGASGGFTLFEILMAILIMTIAIVPMIQAFGPALFFTGTEEGVGVFTNRARHTLNRIVAADFGTLDDLVRNNQANPVNLDALFGAGQESFSFRGVTYTPQAVITDASGGSGGLLDIAVTIDQVTLKTGKANY